MNVNLLSYVAIGLGTVSGIHDSKLKEAGCFLEAAIDPITTTHAKVSPEIPVFVSVDDFLREKRTPPSFWDVRTPSDSHFAVVRQISRVYPSANMVVEKPICLPEEIAEFKEFLKTHKGKICVNENYLQSNTTKKVKECIAYWLKEIREVKIEMSKNRSEDFKRGRYQDKRGALMYEGSHMLSILKQLDARLVPSADALKTTASVSLTDAVVDGNVLPYQGGATVNYRTDDGIAVEIYSSMEGKIKNGFLFERLKRNLVDEIQNEEIQDVLKRHRVVVIHGVDTVDRPTTILGFYDPLTVEKGHAIAGAVFVIQGGRVIEKQFPIPDDTMSNNLRAVVEYFKGDRADNPNHPDDAIQIVEVMDTLTRDCAS